MEGNGKTRILEIEDYCPSFICDQCGKEIFADDQEQYRYAEYKVYWDKKTHTWESQPKQLCWNCEKGQRRRNLTEKEKDELKKKGIRPHRTTSGVGWGMYDFA